MAKKISKPAPKKIIQPGKSTKKTVKKAVKKAVKKSPAGKRPEKMYKTEAERTPYKIKWRSEKEEKERLAFLAYWDNKYPLKNKK
jgi:hypothetical protein